MQPPGTARRGTFALAPGVRPGHLGAFLFAAFLSIGLLTFVAQLQPLVLHVNLGVPPERQGALSGSLAFVAELVIALTIGVWGSASDRVGRRVIFAAGFALLALGYAAFAFADDPVQLALYRGVVALGAAAVTGMLATVLADYARDESRGALTGLTYVLNGLGVLVFLFVVARLPSIFEQAGASPVWAGRYAALVVAGVCLVGAVAMLGLRSGAGGAQPAREPLLTLLRGGLTAGRRPRIALAYATAFVSRGDLAVVGTFLTLWAVQAAQTEGASVAAATARAGMVVGVVQAAALVWAIVFGWLADRIDRLTATAIAMALAAAGYLAMGLESTPFGGSGTFAAVLLGIGQMSAILASQVLVAQEAPIEARGSVLGVYGICGALGILFVSVVGGQLFDAWRPGAPFLLMAAANAALVVATLAVRLRRAPASRPAAVEG